jgi:transposase
MLDKILNLKDIIIEWCQHIEDIGIYFHVKGRNEKAICPRCGEVSDKIHQKYFQLNLILVNKLATKIFLVVQGVSLGAIKFKQPKPSPDTSIERASP